MPAGKSRDLEAMRSICPALACGSRGRFTDKILIMRYPEMSASVGTGHAILSHAGWPDTIFDAVFRSALLCVHTAGVERLPHR